MHNTAKRMLAKTMAVTLAFLMVGVQAPNSDAAKKPILSVKKITLSQKKSKKINIKNVKAKKVKKLTVKTSKKSVATVKKSGKTAIKVTGKKAGKAVIKVGVKVGSKTTNLTLNVVVKKADSNKATATPATAAPTSAATVTKAPTVTNAPATTAPTATPVATPKIGDTIFTDTFEDGTLGHMSARAASTEPEATVSDNGYQGKSLLITKRDSNAQGALLDMSSYAEPGATYEFSAYVRFDTTMPTAAVILSSQTQAVADGDENYANLYCITTKKSNWGCAATYIEKDPAQWQLVTATITAPDDISKFGVYFETGNDPIADLYIDNVSLKITNRNTPDYTIPALKDAYKGIFEHVGTAAGYNSFMGDNGNAFILSQYNSMTMGNEMKPDSLMGSTFKATSVDDAKTAGYYIPDDYTTYDANLKNDSYVVPTIDFTNTDKILEKAYEKGIQMRFHTLIWHQQMPIYFFKDAFKSSVTADNCSKDAMNSRVRMYVRTVMQHVLAKEKELTGGNGTIIYAYDVANEYFHSHDAADKTVNTNGVTFWEEIYGKDDAGNYLYDIDKHMVTNPEYVKIAFTEAYNVVKEYGKTDDISLIYNDYNTYGESTADNIVTMIKWLNEKDSINTDGSKICDGVGMQAHLAMDDAYHAPAKFKIAVDKFMAAGLELQVTELDITASTKSTDETMAATYKEIIKILADAKLAGGNVSTVVFWSLYDAVSWRAAKTPCIFKGLYNAKPAFWSVIELAKELQK